MSSNTLIVYNIPKQHFAECSGAICRAAKASGAVKTVELRSLNRILAVFDSARSAATALPAVLGQVQTDLPSSSARVGFSMASSHPEAAPACLKLPDRGRLLFVSPPPSPPNGWSGEGALEEEPNVTTNFDNDFNRQLETALHITERGAPPSPLTPEEMPSPAKDQCVCLLEAHAGAPALHITTQD